MSNMNNKIYTNIASDRFKKLIKLLSQIENTDRQRMSVSSQNWLDDIWRLLEQPTYDEMQSHINKKMKRKKNESHD